MKIEPLTNEYLEQSVALLVRVFGSEPTDQDYPGKWLPLSLKDEMNVRVDESAICTYCKYYVGIDEETGEVIGTTGIYSLDVDEKDSDWVAWYCVDDKYRGKGYGSKLLDFAIDIARKRGKKYLKLYTSYNTDIKDAMALYEKRGFHITKTEKHPQTDEEMIYMQLELDR